MHRISLIILSLVYVVCHAQNSKDYFFQLDSIKHSSSYVFHDQNGAHPDDLTYHFSYRSDTFKTVFLDGPDTTTVEKEYITNKGSKLASITAFFKNEDGTRAPTPIQFTNGINYSFFDLSEQTSYKYRMRVKYDDMTVKNRYEYVYDEYHDQIICKKYVRARKKISFFKRDKTKSVSILIYSKHIGLSSFYKVGGNSKWVLKSVNHY